MNSQLEDKTIEIRQNVAEREIYHMRKCKIEVEKSKNERSNIHLVGLTEEKNRENEETQY